MGVWRFFGGRRAATWAPRALTFGAVGDLSRVVEQAELHPADPLSARGARQLPATARRKQTRAEPSCSKATTRTSRQSRERESLGGCETPTVTPGQRWTLTTRGGGQGALPPISSRLESKAQSRPSFSKAPRNGNHTRTTEACLCLRRSGLHFSRRQRGHSLTACHLCDVKR